MNSSVEAMFFNDLKKYNLTNFRTLQNADLSECSPIIHKAFSSVITRYFIFCEKHPELSSVDKQILYFKLKLDMIARYFAEYPADSSEAFSAFQKELQTYSESEGGIPV